jgi:hypothetical protein
MQSSALQQSLQCFLGAQPCRCCLGDLVLHDSGEIDELDTGLTRKCIQSLREWLRGDVGGECGGF